MLPDRIKKNAKDYRALLVGAKIKYLNNEEMLESLDAGIAVLDHLADDLFIDLPCRLGETVYKICPKCNDKHDGSCENCAWRDCPKPCDVKPQADRENMIVPQTFTLSCIKLWKDLWGSVIFKDPQEAAKVLAQIK